MSQSKNKWQTIYGSPPWSLTIKSLEHLRACHSKPQLGTEATIVQPDWPKFKTITKE